MRVIRNSRYISFSLNSFLSAKDNIFDLCQNIRFLSNGGISFLCTRNFGKYHPDISILYAFIKTSNYLSIFYRYIYL